MTPVPFLSPKYSDALLALSDSELGILTRALLLYSKDGSLPSFSPLDRAVAVAFAFLRADIDEQRARHAARCQRNRENARKRWSSRKPAQPRPASKPAKDHASDAAKDAAVNHDALLQYWNRRVGETGSRLPRVSSITSQRRSLLAARLRDHGGDTRVLRNAFERAFRSPWLNGRNPDHWVADFDWILRPANFSRVLEGTFDDHSAPLKPTPPLKPVPALSPEQSAAQRERHALERQRLSEQQLRENMLAAIRAAEQFPHGHAATVVAEAYASGTLRRLGIAWTPPKDCAATAVPQPADTQSIQQPAHSAQQ